MTNFSESTVLVAGLGISGKSVIEALTPQVARVVTYDQKKPEADYHTAEEIRWEEISLVVTSPAFNPRTDFILAAQQRNIEVISEVELAWRLRVENKRMQEPAPWIGITGTNGKTSTTEMTSHMLQSQGYEAPAVGNIGKAVSHAAMDCTNDVLCVELSSFQLHFTYSLQLDCAAITNISADHLDWHGGMENYAHDKATVYKNVRKALVYNADDARVQQLAMQAEVQDSCKRIGVTLSQPQQGQIGIVNDWIVDNSGLTGKKNAVKLLNVQELPNLLEPNGKPYPHLLQDALIALALVLGFGANLEKSLEGLRAFAPGGHRIQTVAQYAPIIGENLSSIRFIDDSKATNAHAAEASLTSFRQHSVVWIGGGLAKGSRFDDLIERCAQRMRAAVIIGANQEPMRDALVKHAPDLSVTYIPANSDHVMRDAIAAAMQYAQPGDVVLLAPACASMDQFVSYADRGDQFAQCAKQWIETHNG
ncbi:MAG: UDP-N-acetylmuramoyl-L-alanine--D-glutamate ligase [Bifidobacteriaceae bacterium]|nr:UDP-N-acetylmuramoyl-L-alanine--D-glutamate ligase [Bifidobacteriaceae bacterium]